MARLRHLAHWLDDGIAIPGTRWRIGFDPILGLVPGVGDAVGGLMGAALLYEAVRLRASRYTLLRMAGNIALDALLGAVPLLGDLFDAAWKGNLRNLALLERHADAPERARRVDMVLVVGLVIAVVTFSFALAIGGVLLGIWLLGQVGGLLFG